MKLIIASIIVLFGIVFFLFALFPADMTVSRIIRINAPRDTVAREISNLRTWKHWNELTREKTGESTGNGDVQQTDSLHLEHGGLRIRLIKQTTDSVITRWQDARGRSFTGKFNMMQSGGQVVLQWNLEFHLQWYPWEKLASMFYDKQLGPLMEQSLLNLRKSLEPA